MPTENGRCSSFSVPKSQYGVDDLDIAFVDLSAQWWLFDCWGKDVIDLDVWNEPKWGSIGVCAAAGFPTGHKAIQDGKVAAPMPLVVAELSSRVGEQTRVFTCHSQLKLAHGYDFSGMSGGPIFAEVSGNLIGVGLMIQGNRAAAAKGANPDAFSTDRDLTFRGLRLSPAIFSEWLENAVQVE